MAATLAPPAPTPTPPPEAPAPFPGFRSPTYTMVPDEVFDELLVELTGAELKVLLYIIRRTFGFKRESDTISLSQMLTGIHTRDGRVLDRGVGLSKKTLLDALRNLGARRIILSQRRRSAAKGNEPTAYRLNVLRPGGTPPSAAGALPLGGIPTPPLGEKVLQGGGEESAPSPWGRNSPTQDSGGQDTTPQETEHHPRTHVPTPAEATEHPLAPTAPPAQDSPGAGDDDALSLLLSRGVTHRIALELVQTHSREAIEQQIQWQPYRAPATSPAGALVRAIRDAWPPPPAWREAQEHAAAVARQAEEAAQCRAAEEARRREWEARPPEERIAGRLQFWLAGRRAKRQEPTAAEIAAKRAELLAGLDVPVPGGGA
jgi:hypothetical protein